MSSPTKLNTGNPASRPVSSNLVLNAENRDVEREQLNRILNNLVKQINASSSSNSGGSITFAISNNDGTISVVSNGNTFIIGIADGGVSTSQLANNGVTTSKIATVNSNAGTFGSATQTSTFTVNAQGQVTGASNTSIAIPSTQVTDFTEAAQDAVGGMVNATLTYNDGGPSLGINLSNANSWVGAQTFTSVDINGGTIDGTSIGGTTPSTGAFTTLTTTGNATLGGDLIASGVGNDFISRQSTSNGSDSKSFFICGGGGASVARGGLIIAYGNEYIGSGGYIDLNAGDAIGARVRLQVNGSNVLVAESTGAAITGTLSCTGNATLGDAATDTVQVTGRLFGTNLHNNASGLSGASYIGSATYSPTYTNVSNTSTYVTNKHQYSRTGNVVTVSGALYVNTTGAGSAFFRLTLPVSSTMTNLGDLAGTATVIGSTDVVGAVWADSNQAQFYFNSTGADTDILIVYQYTYEVK